MVVYKDISTWKTHKILPPTLEKFIILIKLSFSRFFFQYNNNELGEVVNEEFRNEFDKLPILNDKIQVKTFEHNMGADIRTRSRAVRASRLS